MILGCFPRRWIEESTLSTLGSLFRCFPRFLKDPFIVLDSVLLTVRMAILLWAVTLVLSFGFPALAPAVLHVLTPLQRSGSIC